MFFLNLGINASTRLWAILQQTGNLFISKNYNQVHSKSMRDNGEILSVLLSSVFWMKTANKLGILMMWPSKIWLKHLEYFVMGARQSDKAQNSFNYHLNPRKKSRKVNKNRKRNKRNRRNNLAQKTKQKKWTKNKNNLF